MDINCCRVCERREGLMDLFDFVNDSNEDSLSWKLMQIAQVKIECYDELPSKICKFCKIRLDYAFNLKKLCEATDKKLREKIHYEKQLKKQRMIEEHEQKHRIAIEEVIIQSPNSSIITIKKTGIPTPEPIQCSACDELFMSRKEYLEHIKIHGNQRHKCSKCSKWFYNRKNMETHEKTHDRMPRVKHFTCNFCDSVFESKESLNLHSRVIHKAVSIHVRYICDHCGEVFSSKDNLRLHMDQHMDHSDFAKKKPCMLCDKVFSSVASLRKHLKDGHQTNMRFYCEICKAGFITYEEWKQHMKVHRQDKEGNFSCEMCTKTFKTPDYLYYHKYYHHTNKFNQPKKEQCELCDKLFRTKQGVMNHVAKSHKNEEIDYVEMIEEEIEYLYE